MSSIVSRNPPPSGSTSQAKDFFWMSMRFGTSTERLRRANVRRVRGASTEAKTATPRGGRKAGAEVRGLCQGHTSATNQDSTGGCGPPVRGSQRSRTPPGPYPVCGGEGAVDGYDYRPSDHILAFGSTFRARVPGLKGRRPGRPGRPVKMSAVRQRLRGVHDLNLRVACSTCPRVETIVILTVNLPLGRPRRSIAAFSLRPFRRSVCL